MPYAIETELLTKTFYPPRGLLRLISKSPLKGRLKAVDRVSLRVRGGEVFGLLGPNGAGKTTLIKMLCTLIRPTSGLALLGGRDVVKDEEAAKRLMGLVTTDERSFYWRLTGRENLEFFASLYNIPPRRLKRSVDYVLKQVGLSGLADNMFYSFSSGMKQRLGIARALLVNPKILFLDEPTRSLDPIAAKSIKDLVKRELVKEQGRTIFLSTHRLEEAEQLCDRIAIMDAGKVIFAGSVDELRKRIKQKEKYVVETRMVSDRWLNAAVVKNKLGEVSLSSIDGNGSLRLEVKAAQSGDAVSCLLGEVISAGGQVISFYREKCGLEDLFVDLLRGGWDTDVR